MDQKTFEDMNDNLKDIHSVLKEMKDQRSLDQTKAQKTNTPVESNSTSKANLGDSFFDKASAEFENGIKGLTKQFNFLDKSFNSSDMFDSLKSNIGGIGGALGNLTPKLGPWQIALELGTKALMAFVGYVGQSYEQFQFLSEAGHDLGSMFSSMEIIGNLRIPFNEFGNILKENNYLFNQLGEEGITDFSESIDSLLRSGDLQTLGYTSLQVSEQMARYREIQMLQGKFDRRKLKTDYKVQQKYLENLDDLADATGTARDEITRAFSDLIKTNSDINTSMSMLQSKFGEGFDFQGLVQNLQQGLNLTNEEVASIMKAKTMSIWDETASEIQGSQSYILQAYDMMVEAAEDGALSVAEMGEINKFAAKQAEQDQIYQSGIAAKSRSDRALRIKMAADAFNSNLDEQQRIADEYVGKMDALYSGLGASISSTFSGFMKDLDEGKDFFKAWRYHSNEFTKEIAHLFQIDLGENDNFSDLAEVMIADFFEDLKNWVIDIPNNLPSPSEMADMVKDVTADFLSIIKTGVISIVGYLFDIEVWKSLLQGVVDISVGIVSGVVMGFAEVFSELANDMFEPITETFKAIRTWFDDLYDTVVNGIKSLLPTWLGGSETTEEPPVNSKEVNTSITDSVVNTMDSMADSISSWWSGEEQKIQNTATGGKMKQETAIVKQQAINPVREKMKVEEYNKPEPVKEKNPSIKTSKDADPNEALKQFNKLMNQLINATNQTTEAIEDLGSNPRKSL